MIEVAELRSLARALHLIRGGLSNLLDDVASQHQPTVWFSKSAEHSRHRLHGERIPRLLGVDHALLAAAAQLQLRADALAASSGGE